MIGTRVKVSHKSHLDLSWVPAMDDLIGKSGKIIEEDREGEHYNVEILDRDYCDTWWFHRTSLVFEEESLPKKTEELKDPHAGMVWNPIEERWKWF